MSIVSERHSTYSLVHLIIKTDKIEIFFHVFVKLPLFPKKTLRFVQKILGHSPLSTTAVFLKVHVDGSEEHTAEQRDNNI